VSLKIAVSSIIAFKAFLSWPYSQNKLDNYAIEGAELTLMTNSIGYFMDDKEKSEPMELVSAPTTDGFRFVSMKKRADYLALAKGPYQARPNLVIQVRPHKIAETIPTMAIMIGITATKKVGGAVQRNRAKRRLRVLARTAITQWGLKDCDYVFVARPTSVQAPYASLLDDAKAALLRLSRTVKTNRLPKGAN